MNTCEELSTQPRQPMKLRMKGITKVNIGCSRQLLRKKCKGNLEVKTTRRDREHQLNNTFKEAKTNRNLKYQLRSNKKKYLKKLRPRHRCSKSMILLKEAISSLIIHNSSILIATRVQLRYKLEMF